MSSVTSNARQKLFNTLQRVDIFKTFHCRGQIKSFVDFFNLDKFSPLFIRKLSSHATDLDLSVWHFSFYMIFDFDFNSKINFTLLNC